MSTLPLSGAGRPPRAALACLGAALVLAALGCEGKPPRKPRTVQDVPPETTATAVVSHEALPDEGPEVGLEGSPGSAGAIATLPGFRTFGDGTSRAFVDLSAHVPISELDGATAITFRLKGVRVPERVNRMGMPSSWFDRSPIARVHLEQVGDDATFVIELRQPVHGKPSVHRTPFGTRLVVQFAPLTPAEQDPHYRNQDEVRLGYDTLHHHTPYGEENRRLVHDHEGRLDAHKTTALRNEDVR